MLFTDFLQTHQSNLHPSDRFPLLNFTKIFGGDANPSNNHRVKTGLWDLRETQIIKNLSGYSTVSTRQRACMWAFEWKVIQHVACHGSQRKTTSSYCLLEHTCCQSLFVFARWSLRFSRQMTYLRPPTVRVRIRQQVWRVRQVRQRLTFGAWIFLQTQTPYFAFKLDFGWPMAYEECTFGCPSPSVSFFKLPKSLWAANYSKSGE